MSLPKIDSANLKKPLSYDPRRDRFIYYDDIVSGREKIVPIETLSQDDLKKLIIERHRSGPDYKVQAMSGRPLSRDDVVQAIRRDEPFGKDTVEGEKSYLKDFLTQIQKELSGTLTH